MTVETPAIRTLLAAALAAALGFSPILYGCTATGGQGYEGEAPVATDDGAAAAAGRATYEKAEVIYATLESDGSVGAVYAINRFDVESAGAIADHGDYTHAESLTGGATVTQDGSTVNISADEGVMYYQGDAKGTDLPWNVAVNFALDGRSVGADELGGASGALTIGIDTSRNPAVAETAFYDSFMLQITLTMPTQAVSGIEAEGATVAAAGQNTTVAFAVLPGKDAHLEFSAQVEDFSMDGIQIAALPYSQAMEMPDTGEMLSGMEVLSAGVSQLSDGAAQLAAGAEQLAAGSQQFGEGLKTLADSGGQLVEASSKIAEALQTVSDALGGIDLGESGELSQLPAILRQAADALEAQATAAHDVYAAFTGAQQSLSAAMETLRAGMTATAEEVAAAVDAAEGTDVQSAVEAMAATYGNAGAAIAAFDAAQPAFADAAALLESIGGDDALAAAKAQAALMREAADLLEAGGDDALIVKIQEIIDGLSQMAGQFAAFHEGMAQFADGVGQLSENYSALETGTSELATGARSLSWGLGTLSASVAQIPEAMSEQIGAMIDEFTFPAFEPVSFMSPENEHVTQVQFVMATPAIEAPDAPKAEEPETPQPTVFDRVLALFE